MTRVPAQFQDADWTLKPLISPSSDRPVRRLPVHLCLFFTRGMSLCAWHEEGRLERELKLYDALASRVGSLSFLTYGAQEDLAFQERLGPIAVLVNRWRLDSNGYSVLAPLLHHRALRRATIFKTNQLNGAWCAAIAKRLFGKRLVVRCGFVWSDFYARETPSAWKRRLARTVERWTLRSADRIVVASEADRSYFINQDGIAADMIRVIPNYVDIGHFKPDPAVSKERGLLCYVGKLGYNKNLPVLLEAIREIPGVRLRLIGDGPLREPLEQQAHGARLPVEFVGTVPHDRLPAVLNRAEAFVFPSEYEGHPKALLEAMACGLPVIGSDAPGIRDIITHRTTGLLCGLSASAIRSAIRELMVDPPLRDRLGAAARAAIISTCSLDRVVEQELALLEGLCLSQPGGERPGPVQQAGDLRRG
ncbi:MAG: glycosyltransferase family 4 protein [Candidatus Omnitrophica bacterium]|nr:glycosyltransferase family 4 protein [Candidatus Omnitrophota bacterium]